MSALRTFFLVAFVAVGSSGCMSLDMIAHAEGKAPPTDPNGRPYDAMPGYYALVPLVLPLDLITLPIQFFYFRSDERGSAHYEPAPSYVPPPPPVNSYDESQAQF